MLITFSKKRKSGVGLMKPRSWVIFGVFTVVSLLVKYETKASNLFGPINDEPLSFVLDFSKIKSGFLLSHNSTNVFKSDMLPPAEIKGKVVGKDGQPIIGASVFLAGTKVGTTTNEDGSFSLSLADDRNVVLEFSSIGFKTKSVRIGAQRNITITLDEDIAGLDDIVVVGYTSKQLSHLSSSVSVVSGKQLNDVTSDNVTNLLQGKAAGLVVSNSSGNPTESANVIIRGSSSISAGSAPLMVVDGIIGGTANPSDVESVTILKDASATGLYGSRAANGVIIITTKAGRSGKTQIGFSSSVGFNNASFGNLKMMNSQQAYDYHKSFFSPADFAAQRPASLLDQNTDWRDLAYRTGMTQNYIMSASGGTEKTQFYVSGNYYKEQGTVNHTGTENFNIRTSLTHKINNKVKLTVKFNTNSRQNENEASGNYGALHSSINNMPFDNPYKADGSIKIGTEPGWIGRENDNFLHGWQYNFDRTRQAGVFGDLNLDYTINKNFTFSTYNRASYRNSKRELYYDVVAKAGKGTGELTNSIYFNKSLITSNRLKYDKKVGLHSLVALGVIEAEKNFSDENTLFGKNLAPGLHVMQAAANIIASSNPGSTTENAFTKGLVQLDYNFNNRYFGVASFINESSSRFGKNNRSADFYTLSAGWILTNESFMSHYKKLDLLKIRGSYGSTGNASIGDYQSLGIYSYNSQYGSNPGSYPFQLANPDLTWEKAKSVNVGLDLGLFNRITINLDLYDKTTKGLLLNVPLPYTSGYTSVTQNIGSVQNRGIEININSKNIEGKDFKWETSFNIAFNKNKVLILDKGKDIPVTNGGIDQRISVGHDLFSWFMRKWVGVDPQNGNPLWEKITKNSSGETVVSKTNIYNEATLQYTGTASPDFTGGMNNVFSYKSLTLSAFMNYVSGNLIYSSTRAGSDGAYQTYNESVLVAGDSRWEKPGDIATHPKPVFGGNLNSNKPSSRFLQDGSYIRLRNVTLGYDLPNNHLEKFKILNARLFVSADNLWTATNFVGIDPEAALSAGNGTVGNSGSSNKYPISKKVLFGINLRF